MDIIVTTPKGEMAIAAQEAKDALSGKVDFYVRAFGRIPARVNKGDKIFYVEDGYITGYAIVYGFSQGAVICETTQNEWHGSINIWMECKTWQWIKPIPMKGFQGFRYRVPARYIVAGMRNNKPLSFDVEVVGNWKDSKPKN